MTKKMLLLIGTWALVQFGVFAQMDYTFKEFEVTEGRNKTSLPTQVEGKFLFGEEKVIKVYEKDGMIFHLRVEAKKSGNRIKFTRTGELTLPNGKSFKGKQEKSVHLIKTSASGTIDGYHNDYFLYDKDNLKSFKITFAYVFNYL